MCADTSPPVARAVILGGLATTARPGCRMAGVPIFPVVKAADLVGTRTLSADRVCASANVTIANVEQSDGMIDVIDQAPPPNT